jgi:hypothetical protein
VSESGGKDQKVEVWISNVWVRKPLWRGGLIGIFFLSFFYPFPPLFFLFFYFFIFFLFFFFGRHDLYYSHVSPVFLHCHILLTACLVAFLLFFFFCWTGILLTRAQTRISFSLSVCFLLYFVHFLFISSMLGHSCTLYLMSFLLKHLFPHSHTFFIYLLFIFIIK